MTSTASSSMSWRSFAAGQRPPTTCSLRFSPVPTPRKKRPGIIDPAVAAAWAMIAGWVRMVGQGTPVARRRSLVAWAMAPTTLHTNGLCPWLSVHGWKWSETRAYSKPATSPSRAWRTNSMGWCSSLDSASPTGCISLLLGPGLGDHTAVGHAPSELDRQLAVAERRRDLGAEVVGDLDLPVVRPVVPLVAQVVLGCGRAHGRRDRQPSGLDDDLDVAGHDPWEGGDRNQRLVGLVEVHGHGLGMGRRLDGLAEARRQFVADLRHAGYLPTAAGSYRPWGPATHGSTRSASCLP